MNSFARLKGRLVMTALQSGSSFCARLFPVSAGWRSCNVGNVAVEIGDAQIAAGKLGLEVVTSEIRRAQEIAPAFEAIRGRMDALYVCAAGKFHFEPPFKSFDHLVGGHEQLVGHRDAKHPCRAGHRCAV